jgi:hypothetical protein
LNKNIFISRPPLLYQITDIASEADTKLNESSGKNILSRTDHAKKRCLGMEM